MDSKVDDDGRERFGVIFLWTMGNILCAKARTLVEYLTEIGTLRSLLMFRVLDAKLGPTK